jgi:hypothetical protein
MNKVRTNGREPFALNQDLRNPLSRSEAAIAGCLAGARTPFFVSVYEQIFVCGPQKSDEPEIVDP